MQYRKSETGGKTKPGTGVLRNRARIKSLSSGRVSSPGFSALLRFFDLPSFVRSCSSRSVAKNRRTSVL